jgi:hypothetical protein
MGDVHVLPIGDLRPHEETRTCWCRPWVWHDPDTIDVDVAGVGGLLIIHHAADGRDLIETQGIN